MRFPSLNGHYISIQPVFKHLKTILYAVCLHDNVITSLMLAVLSAAVKPRLRLLAEYAPEEQRLPQQLP